MIDHPLLMNLVAYSVQVACIGAIGTVLQYLLRIDAPAVRHAYWRCLLVVCLLLPWTLMQQPAASMPALTEQTASAVGEPDAVATDVDAVLGSAAAGGLPFQAAGGWPATVAAVVIAGGMARLLWVVIGLWRLRRLRRAGEPVQSAGHDDLQRELGTRAEIRYHQAIAQPVTFGVLRPVVILPETLRGHAPELQRAVVAHELHHVRRRDWLWLLAEEVVRAAFWFHPAVWWLVSRIQLTREEVVDAAVVASTGERRVYVEALLAFADAAPPLPAAAFSRRRHLFTRIVMVSKEAAMSSQRVAVLSLVMAISVGIGGWYSAAAFPLHRTVVASPPIAVEPQPDRRLEETPVPLPTANVALQGSRGAVASPQPGGGVATAPRPGQRVGGPAPVAPPAIGPLERAAKPVTPENPIPRRTYSVPVERPGGTSDQVRLVLPFRATLDQQGRVAEVRSLGPQQLPPPLDAYAQAAVAAVRQWQYDPPVDGPISFDVQVVFNGTAAPVATQSVGSGLMATGGLRVGGAGVTTAGQAVVIGRLDTQSGPNPLLGGVTPVRVGGAIRPPTKTRDVMPEYPAVAQSARVQGVVILEATIGADGKVLDARTLRSIPLLDQAAHDAVRQWEFTPTLLNGVPTPVIMTITVQFSLPPVEAGN